MANIFIVHQKTGVDYVGGVATNNQTLFAGDWNAVHFILSAGSGISIVSDGGTPPTITFVAPGTSFGSLLPGADNVYDIGSLALRWRHIYVAGTVSIGTNGTNGYISEFAEGAQNH